MADSDSARQLSTLALLACLLAAGGGAMAASPEPAAHQLPVSELVVASGSHRHVFQVEVAGTAQARRKGLQYRRTLAPDAGMLFVYAAPQQAVMWMKNTLLPLDMVFIDAAGVITGIAARTTPLSEDRIRSREVVSAVLELPGGTCTRTGIRPGDRVIHPALTPPAGQDH